MVGCLSRVLDHNSRGHKTWCVILKIMASKAQIVCSYLWNLNHDYHIIILSTFNGAVIRTRLHGELPFTRRVMPFYHWHNVGKRGAKFASFMKGTRTRKRLLWTTALYHTNLPYVTLVYTARYDYVLELSLTSVSSNLPVHDHDYWFLVE